MGLPSKIYAFSRCIVDDVKRAADCGVDGVVMEIPSSHHLVEKAYRWPVQRAIDASVEATSLAHELGLTVSFFPIDATRAGLVEYLDLLETRRDRRPRRRGRAGRHLRRPLAPRRADVRPPDAGADGRAARDALPHGLRSRRREHAPRRRGRRRGDPDDGDRHRRARGEHADGGDGPGAPHDVRRSTPGSGPSASSSSRSS